jgi:hypothetical protein
MSAGVHIRTGLVEALITRAGSAVNAALDCLDHDDAVTTSEWLIDAIQSASTALVTLRADRGRQGPRPRRKPGDE